MRFTDEHLAKLEELTEDNEHELALWYAADCMGSALESRLSRHVCQYLLAGELTEELKATSHDLRELLQGEMTPEELAAFRSVT